jgi:uncharacterized delta-60 repeat protein
MKGNKLSFVLFLLLAIFTIQAQPGRVDLTFNPTDSGFGNGDGFSHSIYAFDVQPDGKIIVGGYFGSFESKTSTGIARLTADGYFDNTFSTGTGFNSSPLAICIQPDGKILVAGNFTAFNGVSVNRILRLNADGSIDNTFNSTGSGFDNIVYDLILNADGSMYVCGAFTQYNGVDRRCIAKLNANGSLDSGFANGTGMTNIVRAIAVQADNKLLVGGDFTSFKNYTTNISSTRNYVARLNADGTLDESFAQVGSGLTNRVNAIGIQGNGEIVVGGEFTTYNGAKASRIARLNADGSLDASFDTGDGFTSRVNKITVQSNNKLIIAGEFSKFNGVNVRPLIQLNEDGNLDTGFTPPPYTSVQFARPLLVGNRVLIGSNRQYRISMNYLNQDGSEMESFYPGTGANEYILTVKKQADNKLLVGGSFTRYNGKDVRYFARLEPNGEIDNTFQMGSGFSAMVTATSIQTDTKILAGGYFTQYNGIPINRIVRLDSDGTIDNSFITGEGFNDFVSVMSIQNDGRIIVGGKFTSYNGQTANRIVRLNDDGSIDNTFITGTGFNNQVSTLSIQADGKIIVGGTFTTYKGVTQNRIARLNADGSLDAGFSTNTGFNDYVLTTAIQSDGKILAGGYFTTYNGVTRNRIARLNTDGSLDDTHLAATGFDGSVFSIVIMGDDRIMVGGQFDNYNDIARKNIAALNSDFSLHTSFNPGTGFGGKTRTGVPTVVRSMVLQGPGELICAGDFTSYNEVGRNRIARILTTNNDISTSTNSTLEVDIKVLSGKNSISVRTNHSILSNSTVTVSDLLGATVHQQKLKADNVVLNFAFKPGLYVVRVWLYNNQFKVQKVLVK